MPHIVLWVLRCHSPSREPGGFEVMLGTSQAAEQRLWEAVWRMGRDHPGSLAMPNNLLKGEQWVLSDTLINLVTSRGICWKKLSMDKL